MTKSWTTNLTVFTYSAYDFDGYVRPERAIPALQDAAKGALPEHVEDLEAGGEVVPGKHDKVANVRVPPVGHRMTVRSVEIGGPPPAVMRDHGAPSTPAGRMNIWTTARST